MIIAKLQGGLGNQMFQYAAGKRLAHFNKTILKLDLSFFADSRKKNITPRNYELDGLSIPEAFASSEEIRKFKNLKNRIVQKLLPQYSGNPFIAERHFHFDEHVLTLKDNVYLSGHWMSEKYFLDAESLIRSDFSFKKKLPETAKILQSAIHDSNAVCIQVRRGDYVKNPDVSKVHGVSSFGYFSKAISIIQEHVHNPTYFVFSDDPNWCLENMKGLNPVHFIESEVDLAKVTSADILNLMSQCKHFIISNSTFGWWGAWLSTRTDKIVIAPEKWFEAPDIITKDVYPSSWLHI